MIQAFHTKELLDAGRPLPDAPRATSDAQLGAKNTKAAYPNWRPSQIASHTTLATRSNGRSDHVVFKQKVSQPNGDLTK